MNSRKRLSKRNVSQPTASNPSTNTRNDANYLSQISRTAGDSLVSVTKVICYIALAVFLFLNIKMAPSYGVRKDVLYIISAAIAIGLVILFYKKVLPGKSKAKYIITLIVSIIVIVASVSLRVVYEAKVDSVYSQFPTSGTIKVTMSTRTNYYNATGTGYIMDPKTNIRIGENWYSSGNIIEVNLNQKYIMRIGAGGSGNGGYVDTNIYFTTAKFKNGEYTVTEEVSIASGPASMAEVQIIFERYCTFWEVVFG